MGYAITPPRRRRGGLSSFMQGFADTYGAFDAIAKSMQDEQMRRELADAQTMGGPSATPVASGEEAVAAVTAARDQAMANETTDEGRAAVEQNFLPTLQAVEAQRARPAGTTYSVGTGQGYQTQDTPFTADQASDARMLAREGIYRKYGKDEEADRLQDRSLTRKAARLQIANAEDEAAQKKRLREADNEAADYLKKVSVGPDGQARELTHDDIIHLGMVRSRALASRGLVSQAVQTGAETMAYAEKKVAGEERDRAMAVRDALGRLAQGDYTAAIAVYNKFVPDGSVATDVTVGKDGTLTVKRLDPTTGEPLPDGKFKDVQALAASLETLSDSKALSSYLARSFTQNIQRAQLGMEGGRLKLAQDAADREKQKFDIEKPELQAKADMTKEGRELLKTYEAETDPAKKAALRDKLVVRGIIKAERPNNEFTFTADPLGNGGTRVNKDTGQLETIRDGKVAATIAPPRPVQPGGTQAPAKPATEKEAQAQAKAAVDAGASKADVNARLKAWGYGEI